MTQRPIDQIVPAREISEGAGVTVHRTIGTPALRHFDPFLMLDHFSSDDPDDYIAGFPDHPHRGFITFTYMLDGHLLHRDSMGNRGDLRAGGAQWMKAASGVIHSEMPQQSDGLMRGFQLWINLPAREKMSDPEYQEFSAAAVPVVETDAAVVRVLSGEHGGQFGPVSDPVTGVQYLDVAIGRAGRFRQPVAPSMRAFAYVFEGDAQIGERKLPPHTLATLGDGDEVDIIAGDSGARLILVAGRPINEPIVQYGPFVMSTQDEIRQALEDFRGNRLVRKKASFATD